VSPEDGSQLPCLLARGQKACDLQAGTKCAGAPVWRFCGAKPSVFCKHQRGSCLPEISPCVLESGLAPGRSGTPNVQHHQSGSINVLFTYSGTVANIGVSENGISKWNFLLAFNALPNHQLSLHEFGHREQHIWKCRLFKSHSGVTI
jgi:hypothetical protein